MMEKSHRVYTYLSSSHVIAWLCMSSLMSYFVSGICHTIIRVSPMFWFALPP
jgi:hypothetical protein